MSEYDVTFSDDNVTEDYGLKAAFVGDWQEGQHRGNFTTVFYDPSLDTLTEGYLKFVEATFQWGLSRAELAAKVCAILDNIIDEDIQTILDRAHDPDAE